MIERNIDILRAKSGLTGQSSQQARENTPKEVPPKRLPESCSKAVTKAVPKMLELFDHLQWGDGKLYNNLQQRMLQRWCIRCETQDVGQSLKWIVAHDLLLKLNPKVLPNFDESLNF